jgi:hypothetical protein
LLASEGPVVLLALHLHRKARVHRRKRVDRTRIARHESAAILL